jgi:hypothetical protein
LGEKVIPALQRQFCSVDVTASRDLSNAQGGSQFLALAAYGSYQKPAEDPALRPFTSTANDLYYKAASPYARAT